MPADPSHSYGRNPFAIPEPYYLPGYTGHCPHYKGVIGQTYGRATHDLLREEPRSASGRLKTLQDVNRPNFTMDELDLLRERMAMQERAVLTDDIAPGYKGHVPRASQIIGLNFNKSCIRGMAEFETRRRKLKEMLRIPTDPDTLK